MYMYGGVLYLESPNRACIFIVHIIIHPKYVVLHVQLHEHYKVDITSYSIICFIPPPPPSKCGPRLSPEAADKLRNRYVMMRSRARQHERDTAKRINIPITVRQLEAVIRIAESLAKMSLLPFALESHVEEALRLFQVSTLDAAMSGTLSGTSGIVVSLVECVYNTCIIVYVWRSGVIIVMCAYRVCFICM